jgi:polar amino acid transport system substrate-binding protein
LSLALFLPLFSPSASNSKDARIIIATEYWPPFRISDDASPSGFSGIDIEIINELSKAIGIDVEIQHHPWARALEQIRNGQADMITGIAYTKERDSFMYYIPVSYCSVHPVFYTQKGKGQLIRAYTDLYNNSVGYSIYSVYFEPFDSDPKIKKTGLSSEAQLLQVLALGRIDIIIGTDPNLSYEIARLGYSNVLAPTSYQPSKNTELFITISRKSPIMARSKEIEQILQRLMKEGKIDKIISSYR